MPQEYSRIDGGHARGDSLELDSLATSDDLSSIHSLSDRGLSPIRDGEFDSDGGLDTPARGHRRSLSISTIGDWYNLAASRDEQVGGRLEKQKKLSFFHGLALVVGLQIGSGIFASPNQVNEHAGSVGSSLIVWLVAGLLAWTGASSFAELGSAIPLNGSSQAYLNHIFGPLLSFLFSWTALMILKPGSTAIIAIIFAEYLGKGLGGELATSYWFQKGIAIFGLALTTLANCYSTRLGAHLGSVFLVVKIAMLLSIAVIGLVNLIVHVSKGSLLQLQDENLFEGSSKNLGEYAIAIYAGLWAYDGWDNVNYVAAEMKKPTKDLPRVINTAMPLVIIAYLITNLSYYSVLTDNQIKDAASVALTFARSMFHTGLAQVVVAILISLSCIGALNATIFSSARLVYSSAEEGFIPSFFAKLNKNRGTPINAFLFQAAVTTVFIIVGEFDSLLSFYGVAGYSFYFLTVFGVILLRFREPDLERPYKTFIVTPILFCCVALFLVTRTLFEKPLQSLFVGLFILLGLVVYYVVQPWPAAVANALGRIGIQQPSRK